MLAPGGTTHYNHGPAVWVKMNQLHTSKCIDVPTASSCQKQDQLVHNTSILHKLQSDDYQTEQSGPILTGSKKYPITQSANIEVNMQ